jgi:predicted GNAT family N-acyltransferase
VRHIGSFEVDGTATGDAGIRIADTGEDLRKIGALRYSLFVARDRKAYPAADHDRRCFIEHIDHESLNILGETSGGCCLSAIRLTRAETALRDDYLRRLLSHSPFDAAGYPRLTVVSRLTAADDRDAKPLMLGVMREGYRVALANGIDFAVAATRSALVPLFQRVGFVATGTTYVETVAGEMIVLALDVRDRVHLGAVGSIFLDVLDQSESRQRVGIST